MSRAITPSPARKETQRRPPRDHAVMWRSPAFHDLEVMRATFVTHAFGRHTHDEFAIGLIEQGTQVFSYRGDHRVSTAGDIVILQPGEVHTGRAGTPDGYTYRMLYPPPEWLERAAADLGGRRSSLPYFPEPVLSDTDLGTRILTLHHALEGSAARLTRDSLLLAIMTRFVTRHSQQRPAPQRSGREPNAVRTVRAYLEEHSAEDVSLDQLASIAGLSSFHLVRTFSSAAGLPPHAYLDQIRVRNARALLRAGMPIAEVAVTTGFADQSHLNRRFKRLVGVTPGQYVAGSKNIQDMAR